MVSLTINVKSRAGIHQCKLEKIDEDQLLDQFEMRQRDERGYRDERWVSPERTAKAFKDMIGRAIDHDVARQLEITVELEEPYSEMLDLVKEQLGLDPSEYLRQRLQRVVDEGQGSLYEWLAIAS